ncbi:M23 family metallopeptidase [Sphingobacterium pedocola]|uniref:M23ase beta-sheet core domain-containing protein n=1 Tax=Sphingobacterium pedocola TaxID=2082722 RepID=A0ABR9T3L2_9SPHI|nr:M23 family metallopeptidase [Sphingobacterium pedocola]MBE8719629.1 hypothetical protein [Sphingobacterium pedocola]
MKHWPIYIILLLLISACTHIRTLLQHTERGKYESSFPRNDSLFGLWKASHERAMADPLQIELPYLATIQIGHPDASAIVYAVSVKQGQQLVAELKRPSDGVGFLLEFFNSNTTPSKKLLAELSSASSTVEWSAHDDDSVRISLQPLLNDSAVYHVKIYTQPAYHFPVIGKDNGAIQSFWGADRDGGARRHEGIDIFAARGTPVLAVSDGRIDFAGERGTLGGKQIWLSENKLGFRVYYAHLDSTAVHSGRQVLRGDTVGFVGNTGNAAGGPPHLHFGVYGRGGAVDPLNFVKKFAIPTDWEYDTLQPKALTERMLLRAGPGTSYPTRLQLDKGEPVKLLAQTGKWLHVVARDTIAGFVRR